MNRLLKTLAISLLLLAATPLHAEQPAPDADDRVKALDDLTPDELKTSLDLGKYADLIRQFQKKEAIALIKEKYNTRTTGCNVETTRQGEIIIITIPASKLFAPNAIELRPDADQWLTPLKRYTRHPDMYRMLLVMHSDDTGSEQYTDDLTLSRVDAVFDWFADHDVDTRYIFPTASGATDPLPGVENTTMENRERNRRLEVWLIPGKAMLDDARRGRIAL